MSTNSLDMLRSQWTELYSKTLPALAKKRDQAQSKWPVSLDHCFARIILDNTIGRGVLQWDNVIKKPAVKNMDEAQFTAAISLGEDIRQGKANLVDLDQKSLKARGKGQNKYQQEASGEPDAKPSNKKRAATVTADDHHPDTNSHKRSKQSTLPFARSPSSKRTISSPRLLSSSSSSSSSPPSSPPAVEPQSTTAPNSGSKRPKPNMEFQGLTDTALLDKIAQHPGLTPYRRRLYSTLLSVPRGSYTTYAAMAKALDSSARAVGNGMRNNPFAPDVPCHRVLAADGSIGGFHGDWGKDGKYANHKVGLLADEGVKFDSRGKVKGPVFTALKDLSRSGVVAV